MQPRISSYLILALLACTAPAAADGAGEAVTSMEASPGQARLIATDQLVGRQVVTREGERVGTLRYVTLDLDEGAISHLVVDTADGDFGASGAAASPGTGAPASPEAAATQSTASQPSAAAADSGEDLLIVPWSVADLGSRDDQVIIAATGHHIANAPRLKRQELNRLSEPTVATYVVDYWAPASELAALESERRQRHDQTKSQSGTSNAPSPETRQPESQAPVPPSPERQPRQALQAPGTHSAAEATRQQARPQSSAARAAAARPATNTAASGAADVQDGKRMMLVGQEVVAEVVPPMYQLSQDLEGARVTDQSGHAVGEIRRIMIDADTGDAAFAVLEGTAAGTAPVPLQALEWTAKGSTMLTANPESLQADPALTAASGQSGQISRAHLARLYQRFDVDPYWQADADPSHTTEMPQ